MADSISCSRCDSPLDTTGYPKWCKSCRSKYKREYADLQKQMAEGRGFAAGAEAMRAQVMAGLGRYHPASMLRVAETADWLRKLPTPEPTSEPS